MQRTIQGFGKRFSGWLRHHKRVLLIFFASLLALSVLVQILFPSTKALPFTSVVDQRVDFKSREEIAKIAHEKFADARVTLTAGDKTYSDDLSVFGATINPDEMASHILNYPLIIRLIPFSIMWYHPQADRFAIEFEDAQLVEIAKKASQALSAAPSNASLAIKAGKLKVEAAADGQLVSPEMIVDEVKRATYSSGETIHDIEGERKKPMVSDDAIAAVKSQAEAMLDRQVTINVQGVDETFSPSRNEIAQWITIKTNEKNEVSMTLSPKNVAQYIADINKKVAIKPTVTLVKLRDGKEQSRGNGKPGRALVSDKVAETIINQLMSTQEPSITIQATREKTKSPITYERSYSATQAGLTAYVAHTTSKGDIKIAIRQLDGDGLFSYGGARDSIPAASTYKLFVMLRVFDDIRRDKRDWDDKVDGETLTTCFERMIVVSANNCAETLIKEYGAQKLTDYIHNKGFSRGTGFTFSDATHATAADLVKLLSGIEDGSLVRGQDRNMLLEKMARQTYRNGIPAGSKGRVYDKVGFLWDYNHDAAIVRHPEGTYAAAIMTKGHSFGKIAEITRQLEKIMYP